MPRKHVELIGPSGVGKTAIARELEHLGFDQIFSFPVFIRYSSRILSRLLLKLLPDDSRLSCLPFFSKYGP